MAKKNCSVKGCKDEHHAKGYCNRHYKKYMKYEDPEAGRFNDNRGPRNTYQPEPEPVKPRLQKKNFNFFINQKTIERLFSEAVKAKHEPTYKAANGENIFHILRLAAIMAGANSKDTGFMADLLGELELWAEYKDKVRFMDALVNWEQRLLEYSSPIKNITQLNLFSHSQ